MSGKPCVGCGWCCLTDQCMVSHRRYGYRRRCPDLLWDEKQHRYLCLLMLDPDLGPSVRHELSAGQGCCAPLMPWRDDVRNRDHVRGGAAKPPPGTAPSNGPASEKDRASCMRPQPHTDLDPDPN